MGHLFQSKKRMQLIHKFQREGRFNPNDFMVENAISIEKIKQIYAKFPESDKIANRVIATWDKDQSGTISLPEISELISNSDGKISYGDFDPVDAGSVNILKSAWDLFLVSVIA